MRFLYPCSITLCFRNFNQTCLDCGLPTYPFEEMTKIVMDEHHCRLTVSSTINALVHWWVTAQK